MKKLDSYIKSNFDPVFSGRKAEKQKKIENNHKLVSKTVLSTKEL